MVREKKFKTFLFRDVILAYFITIFMTDLRLVIINSAVAVFQEVLTGIIDFQIPAVSIFKNMHIIMGNLPEQIIKVFLLSGFLDPLGEIAAAHGTVTEAAEFLWREKYFKHVDIPRGGIFCERNRM